MTHPLTPREKVARIVDPETFALIAHYTGIDRFDDLPPAEREPAVFKGYPDLKRARDVAYADADAILTALASGSGDHSELARLARKAREQMTCEATTDALCDGVEALLAEIAALRAERDEWKETAHLAGLRSKRATEAERKLAEAVEWRPIDTAPRDGRFILAMMSGAQDRWEHLNGRAFVVRNSSIPGDDYDLGWDVYPGFGGVSDHWFSGWIPLPPAPGAEDE